MRMYMCTRIWMYAHIYTCNKCVIENTTYLMYVRHNTVRCVTTPSVYSKHSHNRHTTARPHGRDMGCLLRVKSLIHNPYQLLQFCIHAEVYNPPRYNGTPLCVQKCTTLNGKKFLLTSGKGNMHWQYCGEDATKHYKGIENPRMFLSGYV